MSILSWLFGLFSIWWVWLPIVFVLLYLTYQNQRRIKHIDSMEHVVLELEVPRTNDKRESVAEQLFESLHGILRSKKELIAAGDLQEHLSFEMVASEKRIHFYIWVPKHLQNFVESQIYTHYPSVQMHVVPHDYASRSIEGKVFHSAELGLTTNQAVPLKTYDAFESDPIIALTTTLSKLEKTDEEFWIQVMVRPTDSRWQQKSKAFVQRLQSGRMQIEMSSVLNFLLDTLEALWKPPQQSSGPSYQMSEVDRQKSEAAERKATKPGFQAKIRIAYIGESEASAKSHVQTLVSAFKQYGTPHLNSFTQKATLSGAEGLAAYKARFFIDKGYVLNIEELATVFHLPHSNVDDAGISWAKAKVAEPPAELPALTGKHTQDSTISAFAVTHFRGMSQQFGVYRTDRDRHIYVLGQTGVGKSKMMELLALSDLYHNQGYAIIDPHGDFAINNLYFIPPGRMNDVVYFNPADTTYPVGFNPMELSDPAFKGRVSAELVNVLRHLFGEVWNTKLEYMLRYIILALLETPGTTMLDITRMLTDPAFRANTLQRVTDPVVQSFWKDEFANWKEMYANETVSPILNKVGAFTANPIIRNIVGQQHSTFNMRHIMDNGKIFVANLSGALLGEENAALLGSLLITKIQQAAMSRIDPNNRRPFFLYVDEFQNFATDSFVPILSESRKYGLSLTMANQYVGQMSPTVRDAVFGNVGTIVSFRISPEDAATLSSYFSPRFEASDLTELHNRNFAVAMTIKGEKTKPFSGTTLALPTAQQNYLAEIIANTRAHYAQPKDTVELALAAAAAPKYSESIPELPEPVAAPQELYEPQNYSWMTEAEEGPYDTNNFRTESQHPPRIEPDDDQLLDSIPLEGEVIAPIRTEQPEHIFKIHHK